MFREVFLVVLVVEDIPLFGTFAQFSRVGGADFTGACISLLFDHKLLAYDVDDFKPDIIKLCFVVKIVLFCEVVDYQLTNVVGFVSTDSHG